MKAKTILMSILLFAGIISAKAQEYFPSELVLVSQPVMTYTHNSVRVYYDVQNIGDERYSGYFYLYLEPDNGYYYAREYVRVRPGRIKRIVIDIPAYRLDPNFTYTIKPYYEMGPELFSLTTFEYFEPLTFWWNGPRSGVYVVFEPAPVIRVYVRPRGPRYYYDGFWPGHHPHMHGHYYHDPHHHSYTYHHEGGYPGAQPQGPNAPKPSQAEVHNGGNSTGSMSSRAPQPGNGGNRHESTVRRPEDNGARNSGSVFRPQNSGSSRSNTNVDRPRQESGRSGNVGRPSRSSSSNSGSRGSNVGRPSRSSSASGSRSASSTSRGSSSRSSSPSSSRSGSSSRGR